MDGVREVLDLLDYSDSHNHLDNVIGSCLATNLCEEVLVHVSKAVELSRFETTVEWDIWRNGYFGKHLDARYKKYPSLPFDSIKVLDSGVEAFATPGSCNS